jgi:hypothetical protein
MRISGVEALQIFDIPYTRSGCHLSKAVIQTCFLCAEIQKQTTAFSPFAVSLQFQMTYIHVSFLFDCHCHMLDMTIDKSFSEAQDKPDRRSDKLQKKLIHAQVPDIFTCIAVIGGGRMWMSQCDADLPGPNDCLNVRLMLWNHARHLQQRIMLS